MKYEIEFTENEHWWGGSALYGTQMPIGKESTYAHDFRESAPNQTMPLFLSDKGRYIWSEEPFSVEVKNGRLLIKGENVELSDGGNCLKDAYLAAMKKHFPFKSKNLPPEFFKTAQYNTWIEHLYNPTQEKVLEYAGAITANGFEPGILIIDEGWHGRYGTWSFDKLKFPNPKEMVDKLHKMGFKVMLWVVPYVCADGEAFARNIPARKDLFIRNRDGEVAIMHWWNGYSAALNLYNPADAEFLDSQLKELVEKYGIDGFKFDGGSYDAYSDKSFINGAPCCGYGAAELNRAWNEFGERYDFHEYKDTFKGGGKAVIQRQSDKLSSWDGNGINALVPNALLQGLIGHPFICPDMVYGGEWRCFEHGAVIDEELFVRSAQCSALFPMMQFSLSPWRVLSKAYLAYVKAAAQLHNGMASEIMRLVHESENSGEPIVRALEYEYPHSGFECVTDEFLLCRNILVAPVTEKGARERTVLFPNGSWQAADGKIYEGKKAYTVPADISTLPWFKKIGGC